MPQSILISGLGPSSLPLTLFLLSQPLSPSSLPRITILERSPSPSLFGQNIDVRSTGLVLLSRLGLTSAIRAATTKEKGVRFVDSSNRVWAEFEAGRESRGEASAGTAEVEILRSDLVRVLLAKADSLVKKQGGAGVEIKYGTTMTSLSQDGDGVDVLFSSGEKGRYDLVVGADGLGSAVRRMVWGREGEGERVRGLGMYGAFFSMPRGETDGGWRRWYTAPGRRGVMVRPHRDSERATVFMFVVNDRDGRLGEVVGGGRGKVQAQKELFAEYFRGAGWECERLVTEMEVAEDFYYDRLAQVRMDEGGTGEGWSKGRVVLLGDAGYCASPLSGMGTTLALNGAYNLAGALHQHPDDYAAAFKQYEDKMRPLVMAAQKKAPALPRLINPETEWGVFLLRLMVAMIYWSGVAKLVFYFAGPQANAVELEEYRLRRLPDGEIGDDFFDEKRS
ncbi:hypothetical protein BDZ85DRAFT_206283 [Elsinoe ampelina]|uniref:FAD-binding domain-containing protein n=1 Tax=Elsinoe ampelina TaxID=302913 RepID=A0A6A6G1J0_9PEZI|nr:hypothetical protein BDZ85DRAFT_206283 [Elsinoe ampelina]